MTLMSCPFCGGEARIEEYEWRYSVFCLTCGVGTPPFSTQEIAEARWGLRPTCLTCKHWIVSGPRTHADIGNCNELHRALDEGVHFTPAHFGCILHEARVVTASTPAEKRALLAGLLDYDDEPF